MLRKIVIGLGVVVLAIAAFVAYIALTTRGHSPKDTVVYSTNAGDTIKIVYCQPYKKDRLIFGTEEEDALVPYGKKWRTGANEATEIQFSSSVSIKGNEVQAGRYSVYTVPGPDEWVVAINTKTDYWGTGFGNVFEEEQDVLRVNVPVRKVDTPQEQFTMTLQQGDNHIQWNMQWDNTLITVPVSFLD